MFSKIDTKSLIVRGDAVIKRILDTDGNVLLDASQTGGADNQVISGALTVSGATTLNGNMVLGDAITDTITVNGKIVNDSIVTLGTTTTNAATKMTLEHDATTTGISQLIMGTSANPQVLNVEPGSPVKAREVVITHSAGSGNCNDLLVDFKKLNVIGAGDSGTTPVVDRGILNVGRPGGSHNSAIAEGYIRQDTLTHGGIGATAALSVYSAKLDVGSDAFQSTNTADVFHAFLRGSATVTSSDFNGMYIDIGGECVGVDAGIKVNVANNKATSYGVRVIGAPSVGFAYGVSATPITLPTNPGSLVLGNSVAISHSAGSGDCDDLIGDYTKILIDGNGDSGMTPVCSAQRLYIGSVSGNPTIAEAYGVQTFVRKSGTGTVDTICGNSIVVDAGSNAFTASSRVQGLNVTVQGSATITTGAVKGIVLDVKSGRVVDVGIGINCLTTTKVGLELNGNPIEGIRFGSDSASPSISVGAASSDSNIKSAQGKTAAPGSIWISSADGKFYVMVGTTWTQLNIN